MIISIIAAMDKNRLIGSDNGLPWHLPADFRHFKAITVGKPVIMGRKTFESIGRPLPGRTNIVVSRTGFHADGVVTVASIEAALAKVSDAEEVMIIGGANFYQQMLPQATRMYLTHVDAECKGDAWFPKFDEAEWENTDNEFVAADVNNNYDFTISTYVRKI